MSHQLSVAGISVPADGRGFESRRTTERSLILEYLTQAATDQLRLHLREPHALSFPKPHEFRD
jgi:hypothetical protein